MHVITNLSADACGGGGLCKKINMQKRSFLAWEVAVGSPQNWEFLGGRIFGKMKKMHLDLKSMDQPLLHIKK